MKADLPLSERQSTDAEKQRELRAALVRRHATVVNEDFAIEGVQTAMGINSAEYSAMAARLKG
jgi:hypothetical protein